MKKIDFASVKSLFWILLGLVLIYVFYHVYLFIKAFIDRQSPSPLDYDISKCRISDLEAKNQADELKRAMFKPGTDEPTLFSICIGKNKDELRQLYTMFGNRLYINWFVSGFAKTARYISLFRWFEEELSGNDLDRMKSIWKSSQIIW